jgi:hypothetical protein
MNTSLAAGGLSIAVLAADTSVQAVWHLSAKADREDIAKKWHRAETPMLDPVPMRIICVMSPCRFDRAAGVCATSARP